MMLSDLLLATERLRSEKKFLSNMIIKLIGENQQLLGENKQFREEIRSLQYPQQYTRRMMDVMEMEDSRKSKKPKVIKQQQEELCVSRMCDCRLASQRDSLRTTMVHPSIACCDSALTSDFTRTPHSTASESYVEHELERVPKTHLQYWEKKMGEKKGDIFKEQLHILETRAALLEQGKHIERLQMKINRLHDEFRNTGLQGTRI
ncbi:uncharacterized protein LOC107982989 isoform X5 [Anolis carolinensis]|uniref:uncharacterized protein LOC107982989 isoform X5 n=1 Tax=Anolis carolinensis TaxID=28377 RepID=UPI002F2B8889